MDFLGHKPKVWLLVPNVLIEDLLQAVLATVALAAVHWTWHSALLIIRAARDCGSAAKRVGKSRSWINETMASA